ncbi:glycosyltransferase family 4 protein [Nocardioides sp. R1-1]|uniref:glycosyltransferase family 4 protein n=1 Tax=Nocardioides sp. R1-1 TaxID=3383502 RepID=UPI0038D0CE38
MRVLHLVKTGHGARWALRQVEVLVAAGIDVHVALPDGPRVAEYRAAGAAVHLCQPGLRPTDPRTWRAAAGAVAHVTRIVRPDLVHSHFVDTTLAMRAALRGSGVPRLFQVPGPLHLEHAATRAVEIRSADGDDHWIASCAWTRERYAASGVPRDRLHLSYYGTDVEEYRPGADRGALRAELGIAPDVAVVGIVAFFYPPKRYLGQRTGIKGHEDLIEAVARVVASGTRVHLAIVGGPWEGGAAYAARIRRLAADRLPGRHTFLGHRDDVPSVYAGLDLAVHPSHSENLGGAAESLLCATPTVATRVGGFPDLVLPGRTGWLAEPRDPGSLADQIRAALDHPNARSLAEEGRRRTRRLLDVRRTAGELVDLYGTVLQHSAAASGPPRRRP